MEQESPEELIFDKAFKSEEIENKKQLLKEIEERKHELMEQLKGLSDHHETDKLKLKIQKLEQSEKKIQQFIEDQNERLDED